MQTLTTKSKYKYLEGRPSKENFSSLNLSTFTSEGDFIASNGTWVAFPWNVGGGGKVMIRRSDQFGKIINADPSIIGHSGKISDTAFSPFNDFLFSTASEDGCIKLWDLPLQGNLTADIKKELSSLNGHSSRIQLLNWHVNAENILASGASNGQLFVWDILKEDPIFEINLPQQGINSLKWNRKGSLLALTQKDKKIRICDPRSSQIVSEWQAHVGTQPQKIEFTGENTLISVGTSKVNEQQFGGWDIRNTSSSVFFKSGQTGKRLTTPYVIQDNNILLSVTKGQSTIHFFEILNEEPYLDRLMGWKGNTEQIGFQLLPTRMCDEKECVIAKGARLSQSSAHFVSFAVPRKAIAFQKDLFPPCPSYLPSLSAQKWASGETVETARMMWGKPGFERIAYPNKDQSIKRSVTVVSQEFKELLAQKSNEVKEKNQEISNLKQQLKQSLEKQAEQEQTILNLNQKLENLNLQLQTQKQQQQQQEHYQQQQQEQHYQQQPIAQDQQPLEYVAEQNKNAAMPEESAQSINIQPEKPVFEDQQQQKQFDQQEQPQQYYEQPQAGGYEQDFINQYGENQANQQQNYNQDNYNYGDGGGFADAQ